MPAKAELDRSRYYSLSSDDIASAAEFETNQPIPEMVTTLSLPDLTEKKPSPFKQRASVRNKDRPKPDYLKGIVKRRAKKAQAKNTPAKKTQAKNTQAKKASKAKK